MIISAGDVVFVAKGQIGLGDGTRYGAKKGEAWCSYFLHWCAVQAGAARDVIPCLPWCDDLRDYYRAQGRWRLKEEREPKIGDIICFGWDGETDHVHHVGVVSGVDEKFVYTVEGNSGERRAVCEWKYPLTSPYIMGYCRPKYERETKAKPEIKNVSLGTLDVPASTTVYPVGMARLPRPPRAKLPSKSKTGTASPRVLAGVSLSQKSRGSASVLSFEVLPGGKAFHEGSRVMLKNGDTLLFLGYVFTKSRDMDGIIRVTAYDQLRYFKNKEYMEYQDTRASEILREICRTHGFSVGEIEHVKLPKRCEDNATLFDIMEYALSTTALTTGVRYLLRDECGKICLRAPYECGVKISDTNVRSMGYTSSIEAMKNRIKTYCETDTERQFTTLEDRHAIGRYGLLQDVVEQDTRDIATVRGLLTAQNKVHRRLRLVCDGDVRVRAGSLVDVGLTLGDMVLSGLLAVETVTHVWDGGDHAMELVLEGGDFDA